MVVEPLELLSIKFQLTKTHFFLSVNGKGLHLIGDLPSFPEARLIEGPGDPRLQPREQVA